LQQINSEVFLVTGKKLNFKNDFLKIIKNMSSKFYNLTAYPNIFRQTYWGGFTRSPEPDIIENRNRFINDYDIKNRVKLPNYIYKELWNTIVEKKPELKISRREEIQYHYYSIIIRNKCNSRIFDHEETYITKSGNYIIIYSPYEASGSGIKLEEIGFEKIYNLYSNSAVTYMMIIPKRRR